MAYGLGSTRALTDGSGTVTATYAYDAFGALRASTGTGATEFRFAGQQDDAALGYQYLRARYYDPSTGRFISKDPFGGVATSPQTLQSYAYVRNNPINLVDPSGEFGEEVLVLGGPTAALAAAGAVVLAPEVLIVAGVVVVGAGIAYGYQHRQDIADFASGCAEFASDAYFARKRAPYIPRHPDSSEVRGPYTRWRTDPQTGRIDDYSEFDEAGNEAKRFRGTGRPHGGVPPPLVEEPKPGKGPGSPPNRARVPEAWELPPGY
jgi:RHS repeat-associated protein